MDAARTVVNINIQMKKSNQTGDCITNTNPGSEIVLRNLLPKINIVGVY